jgi:hypothetical protein
VNHPGAVHAGQRAGQGAGDFHHLEQAQLPRLQKLSQRFAFVIFESQ